MLKMLLMTQLGGDTQPELNEVDKLQLVRSRVEQINELDLQDGQSFFEELDSGIYD